MVNTKEAVPVPQEMTEVLNWMDCWGRNIDTGWYWFVIQRISQWCHGGEAISEKLVKKICIMYRVREQLTFHFRDEPHLAIQFITMWLDWFEVDYEYGEACPFDMEWNLPKSNHFFHLSLRSFHYVRSLLDAFNAAN
jgi:hypothetical protein